MGFRETHTCRAWAARRLGLLLLLLLRLTPLSRVLEEAQPGPRALRLQFRQLLGVPGVLPHHEAALWVGHHCQVAAVG